MKDPAILVVDDVENNRIALTMRLELVGYENVSTAANGREALDKLRQQIFELVLLDIMMPETDGYQVLEEMRHDPELRDIPVIMISAEEDINSVIRCIELGATDYLTKPFNPKLLKARIDAYVEKSIFKKQEVLYLQQVEAARQRANDLLGMLLPKPVARLLRANDKLPPVRYDDVTVLFCDIVNFTAYAENNPPEQVFSQLEALIHDFESLANERNLTKIKTIGDAFMVAAGLFTELDEPVHSMIDLGLAMIETAASHPAGWQVRVGIDHGSVVSGVIGRTHLQFDIWGDTVNTAARIESAGAPGTVNMSARAWQHVRSSFRGRSLGMVDLKGKEPIEVIECQGLL